jgi:ComF family protein
LRFVEPLRHLHRQLKFAEKLSHARLLGRLLADALAERKLKEMGMAPDRIIVMPLHAGRLRQRGFNQALELIRPAATQLGIPLDLKCCRRVRATAAQTGLSAGQRIRNVRGAFACGSTLDGESVVIFDDVVTTGQTVAELARVVKRAGAKRVEIWSLARAP